MEQTPSLMLEKARLWAFGWVLLGNPHIRAIFDNTAVKNGIKGMLWQGQKTFQYTFFFTLNYKSSYTTICHTYSAVLGDALLPTFLLNKPLRSLLWQKLSQNCCWPAPRATTVYSLKIYYRSISDRNKFEYRYLIYSINKISK